MNKKRILIVDDDVKILETIKSEFPYDTVFTETDPQKAISLIKNTFFDLVFCDYIFTGSSCTGLNIFEEAARIYRGQVYVGVLICGCGTSFLFAKEQAAGLFFECVEKPFDVFPDLHTKISNVIALLSRKQDDVAQQLNDGTSIEEVI